MLPNDVILRVDVEVYVMDEHPEGEKFPHMLASDGNVSSDRKHPSILSNSLSHLPVLSPRGLKDERCNVLRLAAKQPGGVLKRRFGPIAHDDGSGGVEKNHGPPRCKGCPGRPGAWTALSIQTKAI